jgi:predicted Zn-dependent protease
MNEAPRRRQVNLPFLAASVLFFSLLAVGTYFLHDYQLHRNCRMLREEAERAEAANDLEKAADCWSRYFSLAPDDLEALARQALLMDRRNPGSVAKYRVYLALEDILRRAPDAELLQARCRAAEIALELGRPGEARTHLERVVRDNDNDPDLQDLLGQCEEAERQFDKARTAYAAALKRSPQRARTALRLAYLLRSDLNPAPEARRSSDADSVMDALVRAAPDSFEARLARCRYRQAVGNLYLAERDLAYLREKLAPDDIELLVASAELADARGRSDEARRHLELGHKHYPADARFPIGLARLELRAGTDRRPVAIEFLTEALRSAPDNAETLWTIADLFLDAGATAEVPDLLERLKGKQLPEASIAYLHARLLAAEQDIGAAVALLERSGAGMTVRDKLGYLKEKSNLLLAQWYERLGNPERQLEACERVLHDNPQSASARASKAAALVAVGSPDAALPLFRGLVEERPALRLNLARLLLARNASLPVDERNWAEVQGVLDSVSVDVKETLAYRLLLIDLLAQSGRHGAATATAEAFCKQQPTEARFWLARAALADHSSHPDRDRALAILAEAQGALGDLVALRLATADRAAALPPGEACRALLALEQNSQGFSLPERGRLEAGLAAAYMRRDDRRDAARLLRQAGEHLPDNIAVREQQFDLAMLEGDVANADRQIEQIHRIEGEEGVRWRAVEIARGVVAARKGDRNALAEARRQLAEVEKRRPGWTRLLVLDAEIAELEGRTDWALESYRKAIDRGERKPWIVRKAVELLTIRRRPDEARELLHKLIARAPEVSDDLNRLLAEVDIAAGNAKAESLDNARAAVSPTSKEYRDHLWLGQLLNSAGQKAEAEAAIRKAVQLNNAAPEAWLALITLLAGNGRSAEARVALGGAKRLVPERERTLFLAAALDVLGDVADAEKAYADALRESPDSSSLKRSCATFYLRNGQGAKAEPLLRALSPADGPDSVWARRTLALALAMTGDFAKSGEALELIDSNLNGKWFGPEDERARAVVLALRPGGRGASIQTLEDSFTRVKPTAPEQFLLAKLYEADGNWAKSRTMLHALAATKAGNTPEILAFFIKALLRRNEVAEAKRWFPDLEGREPDSARTFEIRARLLKGENKDAEAGALLRGFAAREYARTRDAVVLGRAAAILADIGRPADAEDLFRQYVAESEKTRPDSLLTLAQFLAAQGRLGEALDLCDHAATRCPPELVADVAVSALRVARPTSAERQRVRAWLNSAIDKKPGSTALLAARADFSEQGGDYSACEQTYCDLLDRQPDNVAALNNLAWLFAIHANKADEALALIEHALRLAGPHGGLLDTQACVYLALDRREEAVRNMETAVREAPTGNRYFHLAKALSRAGRNLDAKDAWRKATRDLHLSEQQVHPLERDDYRKFAALYSNEKS